MSMLLQPARPSTLSLASQMMRNLKLGLLGLGVATVWFWTSGRKFSSLCFWRRLGKAGVQKDLLVEILDKMARAFHDIFTDVAKMRVSVMRAMKSRGVADSLGQEQLEALLMEQGFRVKLEEVDAATLGSYGLTKKEYEEACATFKDDSDVAKRIAGFQMMYNDAMAGLLPLLPGVELPAYLADQENVLEIVGEIMRRKVEIFREIFSDSANSDIEPQVSALFGTIPPPELSTKMTEGAQKAEDEVLSRHMQSIRSSEMFRHALALHYRSATFQAEKSLMDASHSMDVVAAMKGTNTKNPKLITLHDRLDKVTSSDLPAIVSSAEKDRPILCLVHTNSNDLRGTVALDSLTVALTSLETSRTDLDSASFIFTTAEDFLATEFEGNKAAIKTDRPHYVLFLRNAIKEIIGNVTDALAAVERCLDEKKQKSVVIVPELPPDSVVAAIQDPATDDHTTEQALPTPTSTDTDTPGNATYKLTGDMCYDDDIKDVAKNDVESVCVQKSVTDKSDQVPLMAEKDRPPSQRTDPEVTQ